MFIPLPQSGMASVAGKFTPRTAAFIVTRNKSAPITRGSDLERKWGERRSAPRDYIFDGPVLLGKNARRS